MKNKYVQHSASPQYSKTAFSLSWVVSKVLFLAFDDLQASIFCGRTQAGPIRIVTPQIVNLSGAQVPACVKDAMADIHGCIFDVKSGLW